MKENKSSKSKQTFTKFVTIRVVLDAMTTCLYMAICLFLIASVLAFLFLSGFLIWYVTSRAIYLLGGGTIPVSTENVAMIIFLGLLGMWAVIRLVEMIVRGIKSYSSSLREDYNQQIVERLLESEEKEEVKQEEAENK